MPFKKGESGNPNGRPPKGKSTAELLAAIGDLPYQGGNATHRERAAQAIWAKACAGDLPALQFITDRTEGKVPDKLESDGKTIIEVVYQRPAPKAKG